MELTHQQFYGIFAIVFGVILPIIWEFVRKRIEIYVKHGVIVDWDKTPYRILDSLTRGHIVITLILIGIGVIFGFVSLF